MDIDALILNEPCLSISHHGSWKILIVDDEPAMHLVTKLALSDFIFEERSVEFLSAYSEDQAKQLIKDNPDIALVLLDAIMETMYSGINLIKYVRCELNIQEMRIVIRSGQTTAVVKEKFIIDYDIHDLKDKTELTVPKLRTTMICALRAYNSFQLLARQRHRLSTSQIYAKTMINHLSGIAIMLDKEFQVRMWNNEAERRTGILAQDIEGHCLWAKTDFFDPIKVLLEDSVKKTKKVTRSGVFLHSTRRFLAVLRFHSIETPYEKTFFLLLDQITDS